MGKSQEPLQYRHTRKAGIASTTSTGAAPGTHMDSPKSLSAHLPVSAYRFAHVPCTLPVSLESDTTWPVAPILSRRRLVNIFATFSRLRGPATWRFFAIPYHTSSTTSPKTSEERNCFVLPALKPHADADEELFRVPPDRSHSARRQASRACRTFRRGSWMRHHTPKLTPDAYNVNGAVVRAPAIRDGL